MAYLNGGFHVNPNFAIAYFDPRPCHSITTKNITSIMTINICIPKSPLGNVNNDGDKILEM